MDGLFVLILKSLTQIRYIMKKLGEILLVSAMAVVIHIPVITAGAEVNQYGTEWHWNKGTIEVTSPERQPGQESVLGLALPAMEKVRVGFVGLGMRGPGAVERFTHIPGVEIKALCDYERPRADSCQKYLRQASMPDAAVYYGENGYKELCERPDIDLVYIAADWLHHVPIARYAMEHGKNVAIEVPSAMTLSDCWNLVDLSERTRKHCKILENS